MIYISAVTRKCLLIVSWFWHLERYQVEGEPKLRYSGSCKQSQLYWWLCCVLCGASATWKLCGWIKQDNCKGSENMPPLFGLSVQPCLLLSVDCFYGLHHKYLPWPLPHPWAWRQSRATPKYDRELARWKSATQPARASSPRSTLHGNRD